MVSTLIIGYGNPLRGDDGIGWVAAEQLAREISDPRIHILMRQQLTPELAADAAEVERLVLIDAANNGIAGSVVAEKISCCEIAEILYMHCLTPAELIACTRRWYGCTPETWLVSISGEAFEHRDGLSVKAAAALPEVFSRIQEIVDSPICMNPVSQRKS